MKRKSKKGNNVKNLGYVKVTAEKVHRRKIFARIVRIVFIFLLMILAVSYFFLYVIFKVGSFTVSLDRNLANDKNIYLSETGKTDDTQKELSAISLDYMDNISKHWISEDVDTEADGSHNGPNYFAYSFYVMNRGSETVNYWYETDIDDSIRNVDKAIRIMIYRNGNPTVYAKRNGTTHEPEVDTKPFYSEDEGIAVLEEREEFTPGSIDRYTVVIWIEGDDPDCLNDLLGGELKMHMDFKEEHIS